MPLNPSIRKVVPGGGEVIPTYEFIDIANGLGIVEYYPGESTNRGASGALVVSANKFYSTHVTTAIQTTTTTWHNLMDKDCDITFNLPRTMKGTCLFNIPVGILISTQADNRAYINVIVKKWDGTTETTLGSASGAMVINGQAATNYTYNTSVVEVPVTETNFKKGETLRVTLNMKAKAGAGGNQWVMLGHDPNNRATTGDEQGPTIPPGVTWGTAPSITTFQIPFKVDLP